MGSSEKAGSKQPFTHTKCPLLLGQHTKALLNLVPTCLSSCLPCPSSAYFLATPPLTHWFLNITV